MAFNPRMSIIPPSQTSRQTRKKEPEPDEFLKLPASEIVGCIRDSGFPFTLADLQKPNPVQVQMIFEWFAEVLVNTTRDSVEPAMHAAAQDVCGDYADIVPPDTRNLMGFFVSLRQLMMEVGIADFSFSDLYRPTYDRLIRVFSYLINFVRFRESQTNVIDELFNKGEKTKARIQILLDQNRENEDTLRDMKHNRKAMEVQVREKTARNDELKKKLLELRFTQEKVAARLEESKAKKSELANVLEHKTAEKLHLKQESAKLRPYTLQSPSALQTSLTDLNNQLGAEKAQIDSLDRRSRALQTSKDSFATVSADVTSSIKMLDEIEAELAKEAEENAKNARQRDALSERGNNVRDVERQGTLLQRQLAKWNERTEKLRDQRREKAQEAKEKMQELKALHKQLTAEQSETTAEITSRRIRIELTEKKMLDLQESIKKEVHAAHDEYLKLESHVKLYITEMEQAI